MFSNKILKILLILAVALMVGFILLNFNYFKAQLGYRVGSFSNQDSTQENQEQQIVLEPNQIFIPSLGIRAPIVYTDARNEAGYQKALQDGVVQFPGTAPIGEVGNTYIFGHSSDLPFAKGSYKTVFALLPNIELGQDIYVSNNDGIVFHYKSYEKFVAESKDTHLLSQETDGRKILTLQTSYPIGTALRRYIVRAELRQE